MVLSVEEAPNWIGRLEILERKFLLAREYARDSRECQMLEGCLGEIEDMKAALESPPVQTKRYGLPAP